MQPSASPNWPVPPTERQRLRELESFDVLNTPQEEPFDGLVEIAAALFDMPIVKISLVSADREWFKAKIGMDVCGTERGVAFCAHAIMNDATMVVEDASLDPRFRDNPLVTDEPGIRFYAGAPLITQRGERMGAFCLVDTKPRTIDLRGVRLLERFARQTMALLEAQRLIADLGGGFLTASPYPR